MLKIKDLEEYNYYSLGIYDKNIIKRRKYDNNL